MDYQHEIEWLSFGPGLSGWWVIDSDEVPESGPYESPEEAEMVIVDMETEGELGS